jgi:hypothetical protein
MKVFLVVDSYSFLVITLVLISRVLKEPSPN